MKTLLLLFLSLCAFNASAQESDDMYFTKSDRHVKFTSNVDSTLNLKDSYSAYTSRDVNPDYVDKPNGYAKYFDANYQSQINDGLYRSTYSSYGYNYIGYSFYPYGYPYNNWSYMYGMYPLWNNFGAGPVGYGYAYGLTPGYMYNGYYNPIIVSGIRINVNRNHEIGFVGVPYGRRPTRSNVAVTSNAYYQRSATQHIRSTWTSSGSRTNSTWNNSNTQRSYQNQSNFQQRSFGSYNQGSFGGGRSFGGGGGMRSGGGGGGHTGRR